MPGEPMVDTDNEGGIITGNEVADGEEDVGDGNGEVVPGTEVAGDAIDIVAGNSVEPLVRLRENVCVCCGAHNPQPQVFGKAPKQRIIFKGVLASEEYINMRAELSTKILYAENQQTPSEFLAKDHASKIIGAVADACNGRNLIHKKWNIEHALVFAMPELTRTTFVMMGAGHNVPDKQHWNGRGGAVSIMENKNHTARRFLNDPVLKVLLLRMWHKGLTQ